MSDSSNRMQLGIGEIVFIDHESWLCISIEGSHMNLVREDGGSNA